MLSLSALAAEALSYAPCTSATPNSHDSTIAVPRNSMAVAAKGTIAPRVFASSLSVSCDEITGVNIHEDTLKAILKKAESLAANPSLVVSVPGAVNAYNRMVASSTGECPHMVTTPAKFTGQFKCDSKCPTFATYKMCSHTIATAEVGGKLLSFIQWLNRQNISPNLTKLSMLGIPKGGVQKHKRKRKPVLALSYAAKPTVDRLLTSSSSTLTSVNYMQHLRLLYLSQYTIFNSNFFQCSDFNSELSQYTIFNSFNSELSQCTIFNSNFFQCEDFNSKLF